MTEKRYVFSFGCSKFQNEKLVNLPYCKNDAEEIFNTLVKSQNSIFDRSKSKLLLNTNSFGLRTEIERFIESIEDLSFCFFYFASHGIVIKGKTFHVATTDTMINGSMVSTTSFNLEHIIPYLREKNINSYVVVIDCCRGAKAFDTPGIRNRGISIEPEIDDEIYGAGKIFISSSMSYQSAVEIDHLRHGLFTNYFLEGIKTYQGFKEGQDYATIKELYNYSFRKIISNHPTIDQKPIFSGEDYSGEIVICKRKKVSSQINYTKLSQKPKKNHKKIVTENDRLVSGDDKIDIGLLGKIRYFVQYGNIIVLHDPLKGFSYLIGSLVILLIYAQVIGDNNELRVLEPLWRFTAIISMLLCLWLIRKLNRERGELGNSVHKGMIEQMKISEKNVRNFVQRLISEIRKNEARIDKINKRNIVISETSDRYFWEKKKMVSSKEIEKINFVNTFLHKEKKVLNSILTNMDTIIAYYHAMLKEYQEDPQNNELKKILKRGVYASIYFQKIQTIIAKRGLAVLDLSDSIATKIGDMDNKLKYFMNQKM